MQKTAYGGQLFPAFALRSQKQHMCWLPAQTMRNVKPTNGKFHRSIVKKILLTMRLVTIFLFAACLSAAASGTGQSVTLSGSAIPIASIFTEIEKQTGYVALYGPDLFPNTKTISIAVHNLPLRAMLDLVLKGQSIEYDIQDKTIFLSRRMDEKWKNSSGSLEVLDENQTHVRIAVTDSEGNALVGATVTNKKTKQTTITDEKGLCHISATAGDIVQVSYVGFIAHSFTIKETNALVNIQLKANNVLEEAVVYNGYQAIKQKYLTGAVTSLRMDSIIQPGLNTVDKMLEGRVPGMLFMQNSGQAGAAPKLRIRGTNTYLGSREPLWVVDGIIRTNPIPIDPQRLNDPDFVNLLGNAISGLNPYDIEQIDVLKDATAAALYGVRAANGVIVITTKRGKPGPPVINYNFTSRFTQRPRYTDKTMHMMDSRERVDVSREMIEKKMYLRGATLEAYEKAILDYYDGQIDYDTFKARVDQSEAGNTDWLGHIMRDVFTTNHALSVSGGNSITSYRASIGYNSEPGVIKNESNNLYTGMLNMQMNYKKFKAAINIQLNNETRRYTPSEIGLLNYAYGTSRAIPLYNADGSLYYYSTISSSISSGFRDLKTFNILNEMNQTGHKIENNEYNASVDFSYQITKDIQFHSKLASTGGNADQETWFTANSEWAKQLRMISYDGVSGKFVPERDPMPYGGERRQHAVKRQNYSINSRLHFNRYLDAIEKHLLSLELAADISSSSSHSNESTSRGYYPERGQSFAVIDLTKYPGYTNWLGSAGRPFITNILQNAIRPYLTSTYVYNDRYVLSATTSQDFSNSFGSRSNEKFLPTWALSGRWNMDQDLLLQQSWVDRAALLFSFGTRGNMLAGQTPYTIINKGTIHAFYNQYASTVVAYPNPNLAWEKTNDYNGSLEFSLLQGKINGSLGFFYSKTANAFLEKKVSAINGAPSNTYIVNGGSLENQGVEIGLNFKLIDNSATGSKKRFLWRFDPQLGQVINKLVNNNLSSRNVMIDEATLSYEDLLSGNIPINGKAVNTFYSYRFKGLDSKAGFPIFYGAEPENKDALFNQYNKLQKEEMFNLVMVESGKREPVLQGSINNAFVYGNWTLNVALSYSLGNKIRMLQIASGNYGTFRPSSQQNLRKEFNNRWRYPGDENFTNIPGIQGEIDLSEYDAYAWWAAAGYATNAFAKDYYQMYDFSDLRVVKGDYLKLQYVSLSYRFPQEVCSKLYCKGASAHFSSNNLLTIANKALKGQDPAQSGSSPSINLSIRPVYAFNLNISF